MELLGWLKKSEEVSTVPVVEAPAPVEVPAKALEGSKIDPRLIVRTGSKGKTVFMKTPCVAECAGCDKQFKPIPPDEGKTYCIQYSFPAAMWTGLNADGGPKTCIGRKLKAQKAEKEEGNNNKPKFVNPLKASKRGVESQIPATVSSKDSRKKKKESKKKEERRDTR